jgi:hypothetical protein
MSLELQTEVERYHADLLVPPVRAKALFQFPGPMLLTPRVRSSRAMPGRPC